MTVYYFSCSGRSRKIAEFFSEFSVTGAIEIENGLIPVEKEAAVVVFPVYCQSIPKAVKNFLSRLKSEWVILVATYGGIRHGNVLYEAAKIFEGKVAGGAYVPMSHSYLGGDLEFDRNALLPLIHKLENPQEATIEKHGKNLFAGFFPALRSRMGVKLIKGDGCNGCGRCERICPEEAIRNGKTGNRCNRCLKCVYECPNGARHFKLRGAMKKYLSVPKENTVKIYL